MPKILIWGTRNVHLNKYTGGVLLEVVFGAYNENYCSRGFPAGAFVLFRAVCPQLQLSLMSCGMV